MVKKRIIPVQLLMNNRLVKTVRFDTYRDVGDPVASSRVYNAQDADELVFLNIERDSRTIEPLLNLIEKVSEVCFMPLSVGGGIRTLEDAELLIKNGADKIILNSICYRNKQLISDIASKFGSQAVVVSIDVRNIDDINHYQLFSDCGCVPEDIGLEEHVSSVIDAGAGEIFINSIERDGTMRGYDLQLINVVAKCATVPVIACGGSGNYTHLAEAFLNTTVSALACGSIFNFGDNNPVRAKAFLSNYGVPYKVM